MTQQGEKWAYCINSGRFGTDTNRAVDGTDMTKAERKQVLLNFLAEHNLALPPAAIHRNLKLHQKLFVSASTVNNYLEELLEDGYLVRIKPEPLADQEIVEVDDDESRAYYLITDAGLEASDVED